MKVDLKVSFVERDLGGQEIFAKIKDAARWSVNTGFFPESGTHPTSKMPMAAHAFVHEHGTHTSPERPFMRATTAQSLAPIKRATENYARLLVSLGSRSPAKDRMTLLGDFMAGLFRKQLMSGEGMAPLAETTVARKERAGMPYPNTPLVATMAMHDAISSKVVRN